MSELRKPPDFRASFFSLTRARPLLAERGAFLLRQFLSPAFCKSVLPQFESVFARADALFEAQQMSDKDFLNYYQFGHPPFNDQEDAWVWLWWQRLLEHLPIRNLLRTLFGSKAAVITGYSLPRRQRPGLPEYSMPFHQDGEYMGALKEAINLWIPLTPAGGAYPGLELWLDAPQQPLFQMQQTPEEKLQILLGLSETGRWQPEMLPGDVLVFTAQTLHRTWLTDAMCYPRISYEFRVTSLEDAQNTRSPVIECTL